MELSTNLKIEQLNNDIIKLSAFIEQIENFKSQSIKALYIVFESGNQLELKGRFSHDASIKLLDLIIQSRETLLRQLNEVLSEVIQETV